MQSIYLTLFFNNLFSHIVHEAEICNLRVHRADELQTLMPTKLTELATFGLVLV